MKVIIHDVGTIAVKELKQLRRDPISLLLTIMFPIILISTFVVISATMGATTHNIPVAVVDLDSSSASNEFLNILSISPSIHISEITQTQEGASELVRSGAVVGAIVIPAGFSQHLTQGDAFIITQLDNSKPTSASFVTGAVGDAVRNLARESSLGELSFQVKDAAVEVITIPIAGKPLTSDTIILPGFLGMVVLLGAFDDAVNAITRERERGTLPRLTLTPVSLLAIYSGKTLANITLTLLRTALMLGIFVLDGVAIKGNIALIFITTALIGIFTLSLGLAISSRVRGSTTLTILEIAMVFPLMQLAGAVSSPLLLPASGRAIAESLPWSYGNDALRRVIYLGAGLAMIGQDLLILIASSLVVMPIAIILSKRTL